MDKIESGTLEEITKNFSNDLLIGKGGYGKVYKAFYNGKHIAVKLLHPVPDDGGNEFKNEYNNLSRVLHPNVVRLVGYCYQSQKEYVEENGKAFFSEYQRRVLCFEYMEGGGLDKHLYEESRGHDWPTRYKIIRGICEGLHYLHTGQKPPIFHLDLKPANILLDNSLTPKIADFGLSRLFSQTHTHQTMATKGTLEYMPPEFKRQQYISEKFDVYSLGIIVKQIIAGPEGRHILDDEKAPSVERVLANWRNRIGMTPADISQLETCIKLALRCADVYKTNRPTMADVMGVLNGEILISLLKKDVVPRTAYTEALGRYKEKRDMPLQRPLGQPSKAEALRTAQRIKLREAMRRKTSAAQLEKPALWISVGRSSEKLSFSFFSAHEISACRGRGILPFSKTK